jgi:hypothetical protein
MWVRMTCMAPLVAGLVTTLARHCGVDVATALGQVMPRGVAMPPCYHTLRTVVELALDVTLWLPMATLLRTVVTECASDSDSDSCAAVTNSTLVCAARCPEVTPASVKVVLRELELLEVYCQERGTSLKVVFGVEWLERLQTHVAPHDWVRMHSRFNPDAFA